MNSPTYTSVCLKIIKNAPESGKDNFDQALDEIKLLRLINDKYSADDVHVLRFFDAFYYKEHIFLVSLVIVTVRNVFLKTT